MVGRIYGTGARKLKSGDRTGMLKLDVELSGMSNIHIHSCV